MQVFLPNTQVTGCIFFYVVVGVVWITITTTAILVIAFSDYIFLQEPPEHLRVCRNPEFTEFTETLGRFFASHDCPEPVGTVATPPLDDEQ